MNTLSEDKLIAFLGNTFQYPTILLPNNHSRSQIHYFVSHILEWQRISLNPAFQDYIQLRSFFKTKDNQLFNIYFLFLSAHFLNTLQYFFYSVASRLLAITTNFVLFPPCLHPNQWKIEDLSPIQEESLISTILNRLYVHLVTCYPTNTPLTCQPALSVDVFCWGQYTVFLHYSYNLFKKLSEPNMR